MPTLQKRARWLWLAVTVSLLAGCHHAKKSPTSAPVFRAGDDFNSPLVQSKMPRTRETVRETPLVVPAAPVLAVTQGKLPLVYLTTQAGTVRIVDDADKSTVTSQSVVANTTIAVNAATGVLIAGKRVVNYPLSNEHTYSVYLDVDNGPNVFQRGTIEPGGPTPVQLPGVLPK